MHDVLETAMNGYEAAMHDARCAMNDTMRDAWPCIAWHSRSSCIQHRVLVPVHRCFEYIIHPPIHR